MTTKVNGNQIQLGDDADTSKNFIISVPATPDGTLTIERESGTNVLTLGADGLIKAPSNRRLFRAERVSTNQGVSSGVITKVFLNSKSFDTQDEFDEITNSRFQPRVAGYYFITGAIRVNGNAQTQQTCYLYKNGSLSTLGSRATISASSSIGVSVSDLVYLNGTTDYIELYGQVAATSGTVFEAAGGTYMSGYLVEAV